VDILLLAAGNCVTPELCAAIGQDHQVMVCCFVDVCLGGPMVETLGSTGMIVWNDFPYAFDDKWTICPLHSNSTQRTLSGDVVDPKSTIPNTRHMSLFITLMRALACVFALPFQTWICLVNWMMSPIFGSACMFLLCHFNTVQKPVFVAVNEDGRPIHSMSPVILGPKDTAVVEDSNDCVVS